MDLCETESEYVTKRKKILIKVIYVDNDSGEQNALTRETLVLIFGCLAVDCNLWGFFLT